jgi:hypothetical protein
VDDNSTIAVPSIQEDVIYWSKNQQSLLGKEEEEEEDGEQPAPALESFQEQWSLAYVQLQQRHLKRIDSLQSDERASLKAPGFLLVKFCMEREG